MIESILICTFAVGFSALGGWAFSRRHADQRPGWAAAYAAVVILSFLVSPFDAAPNASSTVAWSALAAAGLWATPRGPLRQLAATVALVPVAWVVLGLNPNVPGMEALASGVRLSTLALVALICGLVCRSDPARVLRLTWLLLLAACATSVVLHVWFPGIESSVDRSAGLYTAVFEDQPRLQGIFAGPFHAAMAGAFLILAGLRASAPFAGWRLRVASLAVGAVTLDLTAVRTGWVAIAAGVLFFLLAPRPGRGPSLRFRIMAAASLMIAVVAFLFSPLVSAVPAVASLTSIGDDGRLAGRFQTWAEAWDLFLRSPWIGWGPGSSGDALDPYFADGEHVTAHNLLLKYLVEGGVLGGLLVVIVAGLLTWRLTRARDATGLAAPAVISLATFALTGSSVEAIPTSTALFLVIGLILRISANEADGPPASHDRVAQGSRTPLTRASRRGRRSLRDRDAHMQGSADARDQEKDQVGPRD